MSTGIGIDNAAISLVDLLQRQAQEAQAAAEAWQTEGHVFTMHDGRALDPSYVTRGFQRLGKGRVRSYQSSASTA
jgi:hypothetical protein